MKKIFLFAFASALALSVSAQNSGNIALTPPMGWNSWNLVESNVSDEIIREIADSMVANGMRDAGYQYIIIDDFWVGGRDAGNHLFPDPVRFPNGMKAVADYVHSKGLKFGIYSDAAELTCGGVTGSLGFEEIDAQTFAEWGIDYLKYDYCHAPTDVVTAFQRYKKMGDALKATGRPIVFAICEWGQRQPWLWARAAGGHLWRTTYDSRDAWYSHDTGLAGIMDIFELQNGLEQYAGPGGWNDPDMLMVGLWGKGKSSSPDKRFQGCSFAEYRSHFALWAMMAAPLILNCDVRHPDQQTKEIILNKEIIAIDQDSLGVQGKIIYNKDSIVVLSKPLQHGDVAVCVLNRNNTAASYKYDVQRDLSIWFPHSCRDIYKRKNLGTVKIIQGKLESHDCVVYRFEMK
ncbi:Alpha-galactosidase A [anaerobic digester metagenome]